MSGLEHVALRNIRPEAKDVAHKGDGVLGDMMHDLGNAYKSLVQPSQNLALEATRMQGAVSPAKIEKDGSLEFAAWTGVAGALADDLGLRKVQKHSGS